MSDGGDLYENGSFFKENVSRVNVFHLTKNPILSTQRLPRGRDPILSTQRIPRGRDPILSTQRIPRGRDPITRN